jgi:hypothetical protein
MDEFYGRNMPDAAVGEEVFVAAAQVYARHALVVNDRGEEFLERPPTWSEIDVVQATARQPGAVAWYELGPEALGDEDVSARVARARRLGAKVIEGDVVAVRVRAAITHTIGGLRIDDRARVEGAEGLWAAGVDAGGISTGGYVSGLASALVLGLAAAEDAAA